MGKDLFEVRRKTVLLDEGLGIFKTKSQAQRKMKQLQKENPKKKKKFFILKAPKREFGHI